MKYSILKIVSIVAIIITISGFTSGCQTSVEVPQAMLDSKNDCIKDVSTAETAKANNPVTDTYSYKTDDSRNLGKALDVLGEREKKAVNVYAPCSADNVAYLQENRAIKESNNTVVKGTVDTAGKVAGVALFVDGGKSVVKSIAGAGKGATSTTTLDNVQITNNAGPGGEGAGGAAKMTTVIGGGNKVDVLGEGAQKLTAEKLATDNGVVDDKDNVQTETKLVDI